MGWLDDDDDDDAADDHDPFDLSTPEGQVFGILTGMFDDHTTCDCWCACEREATEPETLCPRCLEGRHEED